MPWSLEVIVTTLCNKSEASLKPIHEDMPDFLSVIEYDCVMA